MNHGTGDLWEMITASKHFMHHTNFMVAPSVLILVTDIS
jgi:hypothetical protein